jgi:3-deoxy-D-manno-octulosonic-acid transferase
MSRSGLLGLKERLAYTAYDAVAAGGFLFASPWLAWQNFLHPEEWSLRFGRRPVDEERRFRSREIVWLHAASVGEVTAMAPLAHEIGQLRPGISLLVTTVTNSGRDRSHELISRGDWHVYLPLDLPWIIRHAMEVWRPKALLIAETELWPNLVREAERAGASVCMVNGRISEPGFRLYERVPWLMRGVLDCFDMLAVQTSIDAQRVIALGADPSRVVTMGSLKYDMNVAAANGRLSRSVLDVPEGARVLVAGSTRDGEEELILDAAERIAKQVTAFYLVIAPRHRNRFSEVARLLKGRGIDFRRRSARERYRGEQVLLLDTIGELSRVYGLADVAFVGGSLRPFGGHNPLEPAYHGVPVIFGPHMTNSRQSAGRLKEAGGAVEVAGSAELAQACERLLGEDEERGRRGTAARHVVENESGIARRVASLLVEREII